MTGSIEGGSSLKTDCVSPERRRRHSDSGSDGPPDEIRKKVAGQLDEDAFQRAFQGLKRGTIGSINLRLRSSVNPR